MNEVSTHITAVPGYVRPKRCDAFSTLSVVGPTRGRAYTPMSQNPLPALALLALALNAINASDILTNPTAMAPVPLSASGRTNPRVIRDRTAAYPVQRLCRRRDCWNGVGRATTHSRHEGSVTPLLRNTRTDR